MPFDQVQTVSELIEALQKDVHKQMREIPVPIPTRENGQYDRFGIAVVEKITEPTVRELMAIHDICLILIRSTETSKTADYEELERYRPLLLDQQGNFLALQGETSLKVARLMVSFGQKLKSFEDVSNHNERRE